MQAMQIRLKTRAELEALEEISDHFGAHNDAEAFRQGQRVLASLLDMMAKGQVLTRARLADGSGECEAFKLPDFDEALPPGTVRRWTVNTHDHDEEAATTIRTWLSKVSKQDDLSKRSAQRGTILVMGELLAALADGWCMWSTDAEGECRLVLP